MCACVDVIFLRRKKHINTTTHQHNNTTTQQHINTSTHKYIPALKWMRNYRKSDLRGDLVAGITVAVMLIPQGMAYAMLAGLPPVYGLYAGIVPLFLYVLFGSSMHLSVGPVAIVSLLVLTGISEFAEAGTSEYMTLAILVGLMAGVIQLLLGLCRMGFMVNFLSHPVMTGFTSAAAFIIVFSQLKNLLGISIPASSKIHKVAYGIFQNLEHINGLTVLLSLCGITLIWTLKKINKSIPGALIAVVLGTLIVYFLSLNERGVSVVGAVSSSLPSLGLPDMSMAQISQLLPLALAICLISFIESLAISKTIAAKSKTYKIDPNQELIALGISKIGGAFFQSYPTTGSFSRSAINYDSGANTGLASIITAAVLVLTLLFLTPVFYYLPNAVLASIIIVSVIGLIDIKEARTLWRTDRLDFITFILTFLVTLFVGIQAGVLAGVMASVALIVYRNSRPHVVILGRLPGTASYRNIERFEDSIQNKNVLIVRFDAPLYFGNADFFKTYIENLISNFKEDIELLVVDFSSITDIDSSGMHALEDSIDYVRANEVSLFVACAIGPVRDKLFVAGLMKKIGAENQFMKIHDAVTFYENKGIADGEWKAEAIQHD